MELRHLNAYVTVAEDLHFTRAARRLFMSQSAMSRLIHNLEAELGVILLDRSTRHVALTPAGKRFLYEARLALAQVDAAVRAAQNPGTSRTAALRVGYCDATELALAGALQSFRTRHPEVELSLHELDRNDLFGARPSEAWDLALCRERVDASHTTSEHVRDERLSLWLPDTHPLAGRPSLTLGDLRGDTLLIMPKGLLVDVRGTASVAATSERCWSGPGCAHLRRRRRARKRRPGRHRRPAVDVSDPGGVRRRVPAAHGPGHAPPCLRPSPSRREMRTGERPDAGPARGALGAGGHRHCDKCRHCITVIRNTHRGFVDSSSPTEHTGKATRRLPTRPYPVFLTETETHERRNGGPSGCPEAGRVRHSQGGLTR